MTANYESSLAWLYGTQLFGIKLGLDSMHRLVAALNLPPQRFIHVAGTNGKGSTCAMIASVARAGGLRTGLYTSPHLVSYRERIQINGERISEQSVAAGLGKIRDIIESWDPHPTFFEITTALALDYFAQQGTDLIVLETGMGGRLDATNVVTPLVSVITPIALDHQQWLGQTIAEIAGEKAGIIKPGVPVVSARQLPDAGAVLRSHGPVEMVEHPHTSSPLALGGEHQQHNAALALAALRAAGFDFSHEVIRLGLAQTTWPARFQNLRPDFIIDGAHNPAGVEALVSTWRQAFPNQKARLIFGAVAAKDIRSVLEQLLPIATSIHCVTLKSPRALPAAEIAALVQAVDPQFPTHQPSSLEEAMDAAAGPTLLTGSLYLCGEALALHQGDTAFEVSAQ